MTGAVLAELRKYFTTRMWWGIAIAVAVSAMLFAVLYGYLLTEPRTSQDANRMPVGDAAQVASSVYTAGLSVGYLLMLTIGVIAIGGEYRHRTITSTFLAVPQRARVMVAKAIALALIGSAYAVLSLVFSVAVGALVLSARGAAAFPSVTVARALALSLLVLALWALIGLGIGILIPNQVAALLIGVGVAWLVEPLLGLLLSQFAFTQQHVAPYLPSAATSAVLHGVTQSGAVQLSWWAGALTLMAWAAVSAGIGTWLTIRKDIS